MSMNEHEIREREDLLARVLLGTEPDAATYMDKQDRDYMVKGAQYLVLRRIANALERLLEEMMIDHRRKR